MRRTRMRPIAGARHQGGCRRARAIGLHGATTVPVLRPGIELNGINRLQVCRAARQAMPAGSHAMRVCRPETSLPAPARRARHGAALALRVPCRVAGRLAAGVGGHAIRIDAVTGARVQTRPAACSSAHSSSVNRRDRVWKALPSGPSSEKVPPVPSMTSMMSWVCFQYSYCDLLM